MNTASSTAAAGHGLERRHVLFAGICALILTIGLARFAYTPLLPVMRDQAGLTFLAAGWLATINYLGYMSGALLAASVRDLQRKYVYYRWGLVVAVVTTAAMGLTDNVWLWAVLRFAAGLSSAAGLLLASGLILNWLIRQGQKPELGLHFAGLGIGIVTSGLAAALMADWLHWNQQWLSLGLLAAVLFVPAWRWMPEPLAVNGASPAASLADQAAPQPSRRWMWLFIAAYFCAGYGFVIGATFIVSILERLPMLAGKGGWVWVIVGVAAAPSGFLWDRIAKSMGAVRALMLAYAVQTASMLLPAISAGATLNLLAAVLFGGTFVGIVSLTLTMIGRCFPDNPAKAMARMTLSYGVAQILAPALAGYLATLTGNYQTSLIITTIVMAVGVVLLQALHLEEQRSSLVARP